MRSLICSKKTKVQVHSSRMGADGDAPDGSSSGAFVPDENATVIAEPVRLAKQRLHLLRCVYLRAWFAGHR